jgi:protein TonB
LASVRWDSPFVLSTAGTVAVHIILLVSGDALRQFKPDPPKPAPHIELINVDVPPPAPELPPPPPPPEAKLPDPPPEPVKETPKPVPQKIAVKDTPKPQETPPEPPPSAPKSDEPPSPPPGDEAPTVHMDISANGTVAIGNGGTGGGGGHGKGGRGGGNGNGAGAGHTDGQGDAGPPTPVSVATIKKRAMPKGDQSYLSVGKDYPAEAKQLGIEGTIRVKLVVDATGKVASVTLITKLGHGLDELALQRAKLIEFEPAESTDGTAVSSVVVWSFNMALPK